MELSNPVEVLIVLVGMAIGSGAGGIAGTILTFKKFKVEKEQALKDQSLRSQSVDVEQFKAMFPGGLGDAVEHWRDEAKELYAEVDTLRDKRTKDHSQIQLLKYDLSRATAKVAKLERDLKIAQERITHLEQAGGNNL